VSASLQKEAEISARTTTSNTRSISTMATAAATLTGMKTTTGIAEERMELEQTAETPRWQLRENSSTSTSTYAPLKK
jgi:hypothetical protein